MKPRLPEQLERAAMGYGMAYLACENLKSALSQHPVQAFIQGDEQETLQRAVKILRAVIDRAYVEINQTRLELK